LSLSRPTIAVVAAVALSLGALVVAAPAQAVGGAVLHQTKSFTSGAGTWMIPGGATNITVTLKGAAALSKWGTPGSGGAASYSLPDSAAGTTLGYLVGAVGVGSPDNPSQGGTSRGGGGTAIATVSTLLAAVGGGGGGQYKSLPAGGAGGVAQTPGVAPGDDGLAGFAGSRAAGQGGQFSRGGATSVTAAFAGDEQYGGQNGANGPASVSAGSISLALGGYAGYLGGGGGSGYTGGGGGTSDDVYDVITQRVLDDDGTGGGGSGFLAASGISFVAGSAGTNAGAGSIVFAYDAPPFAAVSTASVAGFAGQSYSWSPVTVIGGITPYTYGVSLGSLPNGLAISASTGMITGTPTGTGTTSFAVLVSDSSMQAIPVAEQITVGLRSVAAPTQVTIGSQLTVNGSGFDAGSYSVTLDTVTNSLGTVQVLAAGNLAFTGTIPVGSAAGSHTVEVVSGGVVVASAHLTLVTVLAASAAPAVTAYQGQTFSWSPVEATGGTTPLSYAITAGAVPDGLTLDSSTGVISGTPTTASSVASAFSVTVTDASTVAQQLTVQQTQTVGLRSFAAPSSAVQGNSITLTAQGLDEGDYSVELHSTPVVLGTVHVDATHALSFVGSIPAGTDPGSHRLLLIKSGIVVATSSITVTAAPVILAYTGMDVGGILLLALLMLALGAAFVLRRLGAGTRTRRS
jgi:hypothetical protein